MFNIDDFGIGGSDFVANGDFVPFYTFGPNNNRAVSFTATSWESDPGLSQSFVQWDQLFPSDVQPAVFGQIDVFSVGTDESVDVRIRNTRDDESIASVTDITSQQIATVGPVNYIPTTTSSRIQFRWEWQESNGVNSSTIEVPYITFGVQL